MDGLRVGFEILPMVQGSGFSLLVGQTWCYSQDWWLTVLVRIWECTISLCCGLHVIMKYPEQVVEYPPYCCSDYEDCHLCGYGKGVGMVLLPGLHWALGGQEETSGVRTGTSSCCWPWHCRSLGKCGGVGRGTWLGWVWCYGPMICWDLRWVNS